MKRPIAIIITFVLIAPNLFSQTRIDYNLSSGYNFKNAFVDKELYSNCISYSFDNSLSFTVKKNNFIFSYGVGLKIMNLYFVNKDENYLSKTSGSLFVLDLPLKFGFHTKLFDYFIKLSINSIFLVESSYFRKDVLTNRVEELSMSSNLFIFPYVTTGIGMERPFRERVIFCGGIDLSLCVIDVILPINITPYLGIKFKINE